MGILISRFRRKPSTLDQLESLEAKIQAIEKQGQCTDRRHRQMKSRFKALSVGVFILCIATVYLHIGSGATWPEILCYGSALLCLPFVLILIGRLVSWYYSRSLKKDVLKLNEMRAKKKKIIEEVMEKETYKVAKQILDKFGTAETLAKPLMAIKPFVPSLNVPGNTPTNAIVVQRSPRMEATPGQLRQRQIAAVTAVNANNSQNSMQLASLQSTPRISMNIQQTDLPRPLVPLNRSALDKIVDYLVSDGPKNRYALICKKCHEHNGMALPEEYEYLSYHCAYCHKFNPSVKQRPPAPLPFSPRAIMQRVSDASISSEVDKEKHSDSDSDSSDTAAEILPKSQSPEKPSSADDVKPISDIKSDGDSKKQD